MLYEEDTHYFPTHTQALKSKGVRQLWHSYHAFFPVSAAAFLLLSLYSRKDRHQLIPMRAAKL